MTNPFSTLLRRKPKKVDLAELCWSQQRLSYTLDYLPNCETAGVKKPLSEQEFTELMTDLDKNFERWCESFNTPRNNIRSV